MRKYLVLATLPLFLLGACTGETFIGFFDAGPDLEVVDASVDASGDLGDMDIGPQPDVPDSAVMDGGSDGKACVGGWQAKTSTTSNTLYAVWGSSANSVFAVGAGGTVLVYQGYSWSPVPLAKTKSGLVFRDVWGSSSKNVFIVGSYQATASKRKGLILRFDGSTWHEEEVSGTGSLELRAIRGVGTTKAQVVGSEASGSGYKPILATYNGTKWSTKDISTTVEAGKLNDVWASSSTTVMAVGGGCSGGTCSPLYYQYDGLSWAKTTLGTKPPPGIFNSVWGSGASNIFMVGRFPTTGSSGQDWATVSSFSGSTWATTYLDKGYGLNGVWGDGLGSVYAVGDKGHILLQASGGWSLMKTGSIKALYGIWGSGSKDVYVVGESGTILHMCSPF